jgi:hypothetical protein
MSRKITKKQKAFADSYIETGNGRQSALKVYDTKSPIVAGSIATENLTKPNVIEYLQGISYRVANHIEKLAFGAESENVQVVASKDILDRAGYKPTDKMQITGNFTLESVFKKSKEDNQSIEVKALD